MEAMKVSSKVDEKEFLNFPARLFKNDANYIRPLNQDIEKVFDNKINKYFRFGECERYIFKNNQGITIGKLAVFINRKYRQEQPTGGIGFFDCIHDQQVANFMFDFAKSWLEKRGIQAMDGPINFGERDQFWGLLIEGFTEPLYAMNYNPPYYQNLFENYGFQIYFNQLCFGRKIHDPVADNFLAMHERISRNRVITTKNLKVKYLKEFAADFTEVYNKAWASHGEGKQITNAQTFTLFKTLRPVINEDICWFVYENEKPIGMWMNIPDINQWIKGFNGKFSLLQKIIFLILKKFRKNKKMIGLVFGIVPEWQRKGLDGYLIWEGTKHFRNHTDFEDYEMQWIGDFNPKMVKIAKNLETEVTRKLATYRYLFDREKEFRRHKNL